MGIGVVKWQWIVCIGAAALFQWAQAADNTFDVSGQVRPEGRASVSLFGATSPFQTSAMSDEKGRFEFRKLLAGSYTVSVFMPLRGEARKTIEVGPGTADAHGRVRVDLELAESDFEYEDAARRQHAVSARQLAIPEKAQREYADAGKELARHDVESATRHLESAVELAPEFSEAWNELGTIAYQTRKFDRAEECFRASLQTDPQAFEPLVNLGGVLVTEHKLDEAWLYNGYAVLVRPNDALANSQMGLTFFEMGDFDLAVKHLEKARQLDPAHFSHPQLVLAEIHLRRGEKAAAADALEDFLAHHPDWPQAAKMREKIGELRGK
jgi:tetratricopeptide (TPR) repeat protein